MILVSWVFDQRETRRRTEGGPPQLRWMRFLVGNAALSQIERNFGKGSIMRLGKNDRSMDVETISSGSLGLDIALGVGGLPRGRVVEIFGPESSGKTTLALHTVAEAQKKGGICAFIDAEHALDPVYARKLGVVVDDLLISQPDAGEQALEIADTLVRSGAIDVLVIDSHGSIEFQRIAAGGRFRAAV
jgi:recombination protein RecA